MNKTGDSGLVQPPADRMRGSRKHRARHVPDGCHSKGDRRTVEMMSTVVAGGLNIALHESLTEMKSTSPALRVPVGSM